MSSNNTFDGFPEEGLQFLADLKLNNSREWFQARKADYQKYLLDPGQSFVITLGERLKKISSGLRYDPQTNGRGSIMRVHRDIRFSKDKSPYNTRFRVIFWEGLGKKMQHPGIFFGMDMTGAGLYLGMHAFSKQHLAAFREAVVSDDTGHELVEAIDSVHQAGDYKIGGSHYKRVPRGFDSSHPRADLLKYNGLYVISPQISVSTLKTVELVDQCFNHCQKMAPIHHWLVKLDESIP
ncbi:MAG: DUF2461 domain-containing protein [Candidatus Thorarchaeota archaeon]